MNSVVDLVTIGGLEGLKSIVGFIGRFVDSAAGGGLNILQSGAMFSFNV